MSHVVTIRCEVRHLAAIRAACERLRLPAPEEGTFELFSGEASGIAIRLPNWLYPVVCSTASGELKFDNFGGRWGERQELDRFLQAYAVELARIEARKNGHTVTEQPLADGSIKLTIQIAAGVT